jgi:uncharacterized protein YkwD
VSRFITALALTLILQALFVPIASAASVDTVERQQVNLINAIRVKKGLPKLTIDARLTNAAEWMAKDMGVHDYFDHTDRLGRDPFQRIAAYRYPSSNTYRGENLAAGNQDAPSTFKQWWKSPGHKANMLNRSYRAVGVARVYVPGSTYGYYWVTDFGSKVVRRV